MYFGRFGVPFWLHFGPFWLPFWLLFALFCFPSPPFFNHFSFACFFDIETLFFHSTRFREAPTHDPKKHSTSGSSLFCGPVRVYCRRQLRSTLKRIIGDLSCRFWPLVSASNFSINFRMRFFSLFLILDRFGLPFWLHFGIILHNFSMPFSSIDFASIFD